MRQKALELFPLSPQSEPFTFYPRFLGQAEADHLFSHSQTLAWQQNEIKMFGNLLKVPRLEAIYGDEGCNYRYSNILLKPQPWTAPLLEVRDRIESETGYRFRITIGNQYRSGSDHIGYHSDDSPELGERPAIASLSLGGTRRFQIRDRLTKETQSFDLQHGDLFVMHPGCQQTHVHRLAKTAKTVEERINWTFRPHIGEVKV